MAESLNFSKNKEESSEEPCDVINDRDQGEKTQGVLTTESTSSTQQTCNAPTEITETDINSASSSDVGVSLPSWVSSCDGNNTKCCSREFIMNMCFYKLRRYTRVKDVKAPPMRQCILIANTCRMLAKRND